MPGFSGARSLPDLKSRLVIDTSSLKAAEAQAQLAGTNMGAGLGKASKAANTLEKDLAGMGKSMAGNIPIAGGFGSSLAGIPLPALAAAAAIGGLFLAGKSIVEISDKWEAAQKGLAQATDSIGGSYEGAQREVDQFIQTNRRFISSQSDVVDAYAALLRQGLGTTKAQEDLNLAIDLATLKHQPLTVAVNALQKAEMGRGKALIDLGINMKDYPVLMETATQAAKKLETAELEVEKAQKAHTAAVKAHGPHSAQAKASADVLKIATDKLAEAHNYAAERARASAEIHDMLHKKLDGGRQSTSDLTQATNQLGNTWQSFAHVAGPGLNKVLAEGVNQFTAMLSSVNRVFDAMGWLIGKIKDLIHWLSQIKVPNISLPFGIGGPQGHAAGGPVVPGGIYTVGEQGPETLVMDRGGSGGMVIPHGGSGGGGGGNVYVTVHGSVVTERQLTLAIREGIRRLDKAQT